MKNKTKIKKQFIFYVRRTIVSIWGSLLLGLAQFDTSNDYCGTQLSIFSLEVSHQSFLLTNALPLTTFYLECIWQFLSEIVPLTLITVQLIIVQLLLERKITIYPADSQPSGQEVTFLVIRTIFETRLTRLVKEVIC